MRFGSPERAFMIPAIVMVLTCFGVRAQTPPPVAPLPTPNPTNEKPCDKDKKDVDYFIGCGKDQYDKFMGRGWRGIHGVLGSVAPGGGLTGGIGYSKNKSHPNWQIQFETSARASIRKYWELDANLRLTKTSSSTTAPIDLGNLKTNLYGFVKDMPRLDFFGIGPETTEQSRAVFHYREAVVGADISQPVTRWLDVGGGIEGIWPEIIRIANPTVTSVERLYTEASAPGLNSQPPFLHLVAFAGLHSKGQPEARKLDYLFFYHAYQDTTDHLYSFRRFDADLRNKFQFADKNEIRIRGRVSLSETRPGQSVPFYLMETLGGSNIRGDDTLRGFRDYRFRDRDYFLVQTEFLRELRGALDFIAFYDFGKVAASVSRLMRDV